MNSLDNIFKTLVMAFILLITLTGYSTGADPISPSWSAPAPKPLARGQTFQQKSSAKKIALSGAAQLFKDTRIGKNLNQYRQRMLRNFRFEYSRTINNSGSALNKTTPQPENGEKGSLKTVSFSGQLDHNMSPVLKFNSRLNILDFSSTLHLIAHEVECDISSRHVNDFFGGRAAIGFSSDGEKTDALIRLKFDL